MKIRTAATGTIAILILFSLSACASAPRARARWLVDVEPNLQALVHEEDTDADQKITVLDRIHPFQLKTVDGRKIPVDGVYPLSVLLQELGLAQNSGKSRIEIFESTLLENPVTRTSSMIRDLFWKGLSRRIDREGLPVTLPDPKMPTIDGNHYLYVPHSDPEALRYFTRISRERPELKMKVLRLPGTITQDFLKSLDGRHGLLSLHLESRDRGEPIGSPFVVPGGRFNVMYGWDSYFITLGLLADGKVEESRAMVDNHVYEVRHYGMVLNGNRTYYLTRAQPPFLSAMALAVYEKLPRTPANHEWLKSAILTAIDEYRNHWTAPPRLDPASGLSRYWGVGKGPCPEVHQPKIYEPVLGPPAAKLGISIEDYVRRFKRGDIQNAALDKYFLDDRALRESGHDRTYRFDDRTSDFLTVDLNSLLYRVETDVAGAIEKEFGGRLSTRHGVETASAWRERAERRKRAMHALFWDEKAGMFFDYDLALKKRSTYISATTFYPLWAGLATETEARSVMNAARSTLVQRCGLAATAESSRGPITDTHPKRQWDYPNGWAPHQMLAWRGLMNYGLSDDARDLAYRWLYGITKNVREFNGSVPEKMEVEACTQIMRAGTEFDNVGTEFKYITNEGFGWMNASYQVGLKMLSSAQLDDLKALKAP